ncbi:alpha-amylase family glycosyl hydrolase [Rubrivirga sp. S365]|uniref:Alpha-amylase family glycosyl hydrolase n=1 Tax=Rubrivirga litoralis TaxID=3075598 RepID=A0ABU3BR59_9BACT|nr:MULTISPECIES: alpha-amylase family glycosyl hydrolase [unclassified Rubrivirga]MDT0631745.1 alpha-amylase family glycosyl hydrolase [Rubrivirga sp. F394]MDT7856091.1 alpha-amylase family glycosyl hydrolase [Rubrivirga sp. S365]
MPRLWWQTGVIYHVYPRSFQDTDGDGVGDLDGVTARLDYLAWLGVDAVWIGPFYPSPGADFGYDVADYCDVDPLFGDLAAFDRLVAAAHARDLRVVVDWIPNHTSSEHPWFVESRAGRESATRDWYVWRDPRPDGSPPNNWLSAFGGPAWTLDERTGQYYLHSFLPEQPDLDWRHPALRAAMFDVLRFWLDRGVDGFRVDVANHVLKDPAFRDNPPHPAPSGGHKPTAPYDRQRHVHDRDQPDAIDLYREVRALVDGHEPGRERVLLGETFLAHDLDAWASYFGTDEGGLASGGAERGGADSGGAALHLPLNFGLLGTAWTAPALRAHVEAVEAAVPAWGWPSYVLGSHDERRLVGRLGPEKARQAAVLLLALRGTPTLYAGDEIGTPDVNVPPDRIRDPAALRTGIAGLGRDAGRTPMAWDGTPSAGFSSAPPEALWLPLHDGHEAINVEAEASDPDSMLSLYRRLLALRRARPALHAGSVRVLDGVPADVFAWERRAGDDRALAVLCLSRAGRTVEVGAGWRRAVSTHHAEPADVGPTLALAPWEGAVLVPSA